MAFTLFLLLLACTKAAPPTVKHAAVAFRDDVPGYQKVASEQYARHHLDGCYDEVKYLEATATDDGRARLLDAIRAAASANDTVDLFFLSNGDDYDTWVAPLEAPVRAKLRFVYNTGAGNAGQGVSWLALGAKTYVGHPAGNVAPVFLTYFLPRWVKGAKIRSAVDDANRETKADLDGTLAKSIASALALVGGPHLDRTRLWKGTEAVVYGDGTLTVK